jgi:hypothetical protein
MKTLFVVFFLINGVWIRGEDMPQVGWSPYNFTTEKECLDAIERAMEIQSDLKRKRPDTYDKRFDCR